MNSFTPPPWWIFSDLHNANYHPLFVIGIDLCLIGVMIASAWLIIKAMLKD